MFPTKFDPREPDINVSVVLSVISTNILALSQLQNFGTEKEYFNDVVRLFAQTIW